ncbi:MAG: glycosyltransferase family 4 protein [Cyanobacteriota bacterium]|nr:glycosyltransferase family 4 protein [Cyanobacteriota bacterium]
MQIPKKSLSELKILYLSPGNLPSQWAHSMQISKMSQAFSEKLEKFELVTSGDLYSSIFGRSVDFKEWYGLNRDFKITYLPTHLHLKYPLAQHHPKARFSKLAIIYALLTKPSLVYTRTPGILQKSLKLKLPVVAEFHDSFTCREVFKSPYLLGIVTTSEQYAREYIDRGLPEDKVLVENNAVDLKIFSPYLDQETARQKVNFPQNQPVLVYAGHLYEKKGISTILKLAQLLPKYQFVLVGGWNEDIQKIKERCDSEKIKNIQLVGHVPQAKLATYLYAAHILLLPSQKDASPLKLFEYMTAKRPIVASAIPPVMKVLQNERNALLAEVDNPTSFKKAIQKILDDSFLSQSISQKAFQDVQKHTWEQRADKILRFVLERLNIFLSNQK